ncbi:hypothetical protein [Altererythrobacter sp. GH1-8]|uniref:hypothetical protein n=1 Tax=Altererythrobacter sp. GH1-8 TaxID=3349333 RepID=UPI00374DC18E
MTGETQPSASNVSAISPETRVSDGSRELRRLQGVLAQEFPGALTIAFDFEKDLFLRIDVRNIEETHMIAARLPSLCGGIFSEVRTGKSPAHSFFHRVSAKVAR